MCGSFSPVEAVLTRLAHKASKEVPTNGTRKKAGRPKGGFCEAKVLKMAEK